MRSRYKFVIENGVYFITSTIVEWIPVFTCKEYFDIIIKSLKFCRESKNLKIYAFVILENHVHLVVSAENISNIIRDLKKYTARKLIDKAIDDDKNWLLNKFEFYKKKHKSNSKYQVWQEGVHPQLIENEDILRQKIEYIHNNPVLRGYVAKPEYWMYSSASNYIFNKGVLEIDMIL